MTERERTAADRILSVLRNIVIDAIDFVFSGVERAWDVVKAFAQRDSSAREAAPASAASPLIVIQIPRKRTYWAFGLITFFFLCLIGRAFWLQVVSNEFLQDEGEKRYARTLTISGVRGEILDRNGVVLAASQPVRSIWADPTFTKKVPAEDLKKLAEALGMNLRTLRGKLNNASSPQFVYLARGCDVRTAEEVRGLGIPGVGISPEVLRAYPDGPVTAHVIGFTGRNDHGQEGIELASDRVLSGSPGARRVIRDPKGRIIDDIWQKEAVPGKDVTLSIDSRVQFLAYQSLAAQVEKTGALAGAVVVADVETGEVLALANVPTYDPNDRSTMLFEQMRNRVLTDQFEPGSTMKPFAIAKALDMGLVDPTTTVQTAPGKLTINDRTIGDTHDYGLLTVSEIVAKSSNIGTAKIALEMTPQTLWDMYAALGFGQAPRIGFPGATAGRLRPAKSWRPIEQATISYGHGVSVSLMQLVRAYTAIARDGDVIDLTLYKRKLGETVTGERVFKGETARRIRAMMMKTVGTGGTASRVRVEGYTVAGKTGTANKVKNGRYTKDTVASFVGIVPAVNPRFIVAVMIDEPTKGSRYGGTVAGPVFSEVAEGALRTLMVTPDEDHLSGGGGFLARIRN
ncbi:penicillin-binding protein 2 [Sutterella sp.]|uniref:peptidoglycan D,D-transpeptidase FtsI family protein n=1 Tax=Sutterella sp. TaxID=1981025 RepID=UPI0026DF079B|nr:penicillin-binding protein 2 [Sutterella sp.]MDO5530841.1 penicillin-binding protein 2 [Sutterella sp.]